MAKTAVADIIIPTEFEKYAIERTAELAQFGQCGIVESSPEFDEIAMGGGREVKKRWTPKLRPEVKLDFSRTAQCEKEQIHETKTQAV